MNKRDLMLSLIDHPSSSGYVPAAFFMHFDSAYHQGQAAIDKHLEFFRFTDMDFVKVQYEQVLPRSPIRTPEDWAKATWDILAMQNQRLAKEGKAIETAEANLSELIAQAKEFAAKRLPVLQALLVE